MLGNGEAEDVRVENAHLEAVGRHRRGEVRRDGRLADAALARGDGVDLGEVPWLGEGNDGLGRPAAQRGAQGESLLLGHHSELDADVRDSLDGPHCRIDVGRECVPAWGTRRS